MPSNGQEPKPTKIVLDTNVLISALLFSGKLGFIGDLIERSLIVPCFIEGTFREFQNSLQYPKFTSQLAKLQISPQQMAHALAALSIILPDPEKIPNVLADGADNYILAAGLATKAVGIVTGDKLFLRLKRFRGIPIIRAKDLPDFLNL